MNEELARQITRELEHLAALGESLLHLRARLLDLDAGDDPTARRIYLQAAEDVELMGHGLDYVALYGRRLMSRWAVGDVPAAPQEVGL